MEKLAESVTAVLDWTRKRLVFLDGLFVIILLSWIVLSYALSLLGHQAREAIDYIFGPFDPRVYSIVRVFLYVAVTLGDIGAWFRARHIPKSEPGRAGVFFTSSYSPELEKEVTQLRERLYLEIKTRDLLNLIELRVLPANVKISDMHVASLILRKSAGTLVVWGPYEKAFQEGRRVVGFPKVNFTYSHPANVSQEFHSQVSTSLTGRRWVFEENNEAIEKSLVIENLAQVALNIIGMVLLVQGYFEKAEAILGVLDAELDLLRPQPNLPSEVVTFCANVRKNRLRCVGLQVRKEYMEVFRSQGIFHATSQELNRWQSKIDAAIKLDKRDSVVLKAIICFIQNRQVDAKKAVKKAAQCAPIADPTPDFCEAFLCLFSDEFRKARSSYKRALAKKGSHNRPLIAEIVEFIGQVIERHPDKFQFHYALGILNEQRLDRSVASNEYQAFITSANGHTYYSSFIPEAQNRLARLTQEA